jgi:intein-encoded DNA endonuclease-like protein
MTGFEISFKDEVIYVSINQGFLYAIITLDKKEAYLQIRGANKSERIKWYSGNIDDVDNIIVKVVDVKQNSEMQEYISGDEIVTRDLSMYLSDYMRLKQELQEEGLI